MQAKVCLPFTSRAVSFPKTGKIASVEGKKIMGTNLIEELRQVEDLRTTDGRRHLLWLVLLFVIMGTMSGYVGYRACGIRGHWSIENRLHWIKDVVFKEDDSKISLGHAPANLSVIRAIALNILRRNGHTSITTAQRFLSNDIDKLLALVEWNSPAFTRGLTRDFAPSLVNWDGK